MTIEASPGAEPGTTYHDSVADFRRTLTEAAADWHKRADEHRRVNRARGHALTVTEAEAYAGCLMAGSYSYTLAAVLGLALKKFGPEVGGELARVADDILQNGDFDRLNADVTPAAGAKEVPDDH